LKPGDLIQIAIIGIIFIHTITARAEKLQHERNANWLEMRVETCNNERKSLYYELKDLHATVEQARYLTSCTPADNDKVMICIAEEEN